MFSWTLCSCVVLDVNDAGECWSVKAAHLWAGQHGDEQEKLTCSLPPSGQEWEVQAVGMTDGREVCHHIGKRKIFGRGHHHHLTCLVVVEGDGGDAVVALVALRRI